jgi:hypothetical protein
MSDQFGVFDTKVPGGTYNAFSGVLTPEETPPVNPLAVAAVEQLAQQQPQMQPTAAPQPESSDLFDDQGVNLTGYLKANKFSDLSQDGQVELLQNAYKQINEKYPGAYNEGQLAGVASKLNGALVQDNNGKLGKKKLDTSFTGDAMSTIAQMVTGVASAGTGLLNAALDTDFTRRLARGAYGLDQQSRGLASQDQQDYHKRLSELWDQGRYVDALSTMVSNPVDTAESIAAMIGPQLGTGLLLRAGVKGLAKEGAELTAEQAAKRAATQTVATQAAAGGLIGGGNTAQVLGAGRDGQGDFDLSGSQRAAVLGSGALNTALTGFAMKYGVNPENLLLNVGRAKTLDATKGALRTALGSTLVEAASNAPAAGFDAALSTGYDKDGNFDVNRVNWDEVQKAMGQAATISTITGGGAGALASMRAKGAANRAANQNIEAHRTAKDGLAEGLDELDASGLQARRDAEIAENGALDANYQSKKNGLEILRDRASRKATKDKYQGQLDQLQEQYNQIKNYNPVDDAITQRAANEGDVTPADTDGRVNPLDATVNPDSAADPLQSILDRLSENNNTLGLPSPETVTPGRNPLDIELQIAQQNSTPEDWGGRLYDANRQYANAQKAVADLQARVQDPNLTDAERAQATSRIRQAQQNAKVIGRYRDQLFGATPPADPSLDVYRQWDGVARQSEEARQRAIQARELEADIKNQPLHDAHSNDFLGKRAAELDHLADLKERQALTAEQSRISNADELAGQLRQQAEAHRTEADALLKRTQPNAPADQTPEARRLAAPRSYMDTTERLVQESQPALLDDPDTVLAAMQTPENLGPRDGQTYRQEPRFPDERTAGLVGNPLATAPEANGNNPTSQMLGEAAAALNDTPVNPLASDPDTFRGGQRRDWVNRFAAQTPTASTGASNQAIQMAQVIRQNPGVRDPLNIGAMVNERNLRQNLPDAADNAAIVSLLHETMDAARKTTRGKLAEARPALQDLLDAYRLADPDAYMAGTALHNDVAQANALAGAIRPSGKIEGKGPMKDSNAAMLARLQNGDLLGALREVKGENGQTMPIVQQLINILKERPGVEVQLHAGPVADPQGIMRQAYYSPDLQRIVINDAVADQPYYLVHELTHHAVEDAISRPEETLNDYQVKALTTLRQMYADFSKRTDTPMDLMYAKENLHEFVAESFSNPQMQAWMATNKIQTSATQGQRWYFSRLVDSVRRFLGLAPKETSSLTDVIGLTRIITGSAENVQAPSGTLNNFGIAGTSKIFVSAELMKPVKNADGSDGKLPLGKIEQQESGAFRVTMNDGTVRDFDTDADATAWAYDHYGVTPEHLSESTTAVSSGIITDVDRLNPTYMRYRDQVIEWIGDKTNPKAQETATWAASKLEHLASYLYSVNVDRLSIFKLLDNIARRNGLDTHLYEDAIAREAQSRSVVGRAGADIEQVASGIRKGMRENNISYDELSNYVYAKRALELDGMHKERVIAGVPLRNFEDVAAFEYQANGKLYKGVQGANDLLSNIGEGRVALYEDLLQPMRDMNQKILEAELRAGLLDAAGFAKLSRAYYYVPLLSPGTEGYVSHKRLQGRHTKAEDPLVSMMTQMQRRWGMVYRNEQLRDLYETVNQLGMADLFDLDTASPRYNTQDDVIGLSDQKWNDPNAVWVFLGDKKARIHVKASDSLEGKAMLRAIQNQNVGPVLHALRTATGMLSSTMTAYNPKFLVTTPVWDTVMTLLNFSGAFDKQMNTQTHYALAMKSVRDAARVMPTLAKERIDGYTENPMRQLFAHFGGGINAGSYYGLDSARKSLNVLNAQSPLSILSEKGVRGTPAALLSAHDKFINTVHATDEAFRYSAFVNYLEYASGADLRNMSKAQLDAWVARNERLVQRAAAGSRELTGNFSRRGSGTALPAWFAFWNAGMQSAPLAASVMSTTAGRYGLVALAALGGLTAENAISDPDDQDTDGGSKFARSKTRETALIFGGADGGFSVPMPYEVRPFVLALQNLVLWGNGKIDSGEALGSTLKSASAMVMPVQPAGGEDVTYSMARALFPSVAQPMITATMGQTEFGTDVDNQYPVDDNGKQIANPADRERGKAATPQLLKDASNGLYDMFGLDVSPARMDAILQGYAGGMYALVRNAIQPPPTKQGLTENAVLGYITANYAGKTDDYAVNDKYQEALTRYSSMMRGKGLEATGSWNVLAGDQDPVTKISDERDKAIKNITIDGYKRSEIQGMLQSAYRNADDAAIQLNQDRLRQFQQQSSLITGAALQQITGMIGDE